MIKTYEFTKWDLCNFYKWTEITSNETLYAALNSLRRKNSVENHSRTFDNMIGYLKCMVDLGLFHKNSYISLLDEIRFLKQEMVKNAVAA